MSRFRLLAAAIAGGLMMATVGTGCGGASSAAATDDPEAARGALTRVLDAWKAGQPHAAPGQMSPPVRVADEDWLSGAVLVDYRLADADRVQASGGTTYWPVELTVRAAAGTARRPVTYVITTAPETTVIRQD